MSRGGKLRSVGAAISALAGLEAISEGFFNYGPRTRRDVFGWIDEWGRATGSRPWVLWCGLAVVLMAFLLTLLTWDNEEGMSLVILLTTLISILVFTLTVVIPTATHVLSWSAYGELLGGFAVAMLVGGLIGFLLRDVPTKSIDPAKAQSSSGPQWSDRGEWDAGPKRQGRRGRG